MKSTMRPEDIEEIFISERVVEKLWSKHAVSEEEVYQVFENEDKKMKIRKSEVVTGAYVAFGRTLAERYLMVGLFPKGQGRVHISTARDMTDTERDLYERK